MCWPRVPRRRLRAAMHDCAPSLESVEPTQRARCNCRNQRRIVMGYVRERKAEISWSVTAAPRCTRQHMEPTSITVLRNARALSPNLTIPYTAYIRQKMSALGTGRHLRPELGRPGRLVASVQLLRYMCSCCRGGEQATHERDGASRCRRLNQRARCRLRSRRRARARPRAAGGGWRWDWARPHRHAPGVGRARV